MPISHADIDKVSLEMARRVAQRLPDRPDWIELARHNLARWSDQNRHAPRLLRCYQEWEQILRTPLDNIIRILTEDSDDAIRLRHNSPFVGALDQKEVLAIKQAVWNNSAA